MLFISVLTTVALSASLTTAVPSSGHVEPALEARHGNSCGYNDFWYSKKNCCVKNGGDTPGTPGKGQSCPKNYYWHKGQKFCVPKHPWDDAGDHPTCDKGSKWNDKKNCCNTPDSSCDDDEFWWNERSCCLKKGGPKPTRSPPSGSKCPPNQWSWDYNKGCCVPHYPNIPEPTCEKNWEWKKDIKCCRPKPSQPSTPNPHPSNKPYDDDKDGKNGKGQNNGNKNGHVHKKQGKDDKKQGKDDKKQGKDDKKQGKSYKRDFSSTETVGKRHLVLRTSKPVVLDFCPAGYEQCPVPGVLGEYECLETISELTSCGGCTSAGAGVDCTTIPHVEYASCYGGFCSVLSCEHGFKPSDDERSCVPA